jgi:hypothetical protein
MPTEPRDNQPDAEASVPLAALRRLRRAPAETAPVERCDLCGEALAHDHRHLLDRSSRALICACPACVLLFDREGAAGGKYAAVPTRYLALRDFELSDGQWDELMIPVGMAFIFQSTQAGRAVAYYPSPAGATESLLSLEHWEALAAANPILAQMAPDVEALLLNRIREARDYYLVPIDACYQLVGIIRTKWRGLSGGSEVWDAVTQFFGELEAKARTATTAKGAADAGPAL